MPCLGKKMRQLLNLPEKKKRKAKIVPLKEFPVEKWVPPVKKEILREIFHRTITSKERHLMCVKEKEVKPTPIKSSCANSTHKHISPKKVPEISDDKINITMPTEPDMLKLLDELKLYKEESSP